jgi:hypothetical protein
LITEVLPAPFGPSSRRPLRAPPRRRRPRPPAAGRTPCAGPSTTRRRRGGPAPPARVDRRRGRRGDVGAVTGNPGRRPGPRRRPGSGHHGHHAVVHPHDGAKAVAVASTVAGTPSTSSDLV